MTERGSKALLLLFSLAASAHSLFSLEQLTFTPYHGSGIYKVGEKVGWTVTQVPPADAPPLHFTWTARKNNMDNVKSGTLDLSSGKGIIEVDGTEPEMLYVEVNGTAGSEAPSVAVTRSKSPNHYALGAAISPERLGPSEPRPSDFDAFWQTQLHALGAIPMNPVLTHLDSGTPGVELSRLKLDSVGSHVQGYVAKPSREGKFPALVIYQYAGVYGLKPSTVTERAVEGWLALDVDSHDIPPSEGTGVPRNYQAIGNGDRETSYFLNMYLRDARAIDYICSRADWDGHTIVLMGTSMGGQQSLVTAGLRPDKITAVLVNEPAGADSNGERHGRKTGYPNWPSNDPKVMRTALYFDTVNFASLIKAPTLAAIGFIDTTAPPVGIWTAVNQIPGPKEVIGMVESDHNNRTPETQGAWESRYREVLHSLLSGDGFTPKPLGR
ncbi:MAG: acetylxylan esterase [Bryobacteraceae bacterium]